MIIEQVDRQNGTQSAYGLIFRGLPFVPELVATEEQSDDPVLTVLTNSDSEAPPTLRPADGERSVRRLLDGRVLACNRGAASATFFGPPLTADLLAHPYLAPVATTFNRWAGREAFHAGGFVLDGRAWVVIGPRTAGKSTLLAALAARGVTVLSDDIIVSDGRVAFQGPRCIDLRQLVPGIDLELRPSRRGSRWRVALPSGSARVPLGGWLFLRWEAVLDARPVGPSELLGRLAVRRAWPEQPTDPAMMLSLATRPAWDLLRPRDWDGLNATLDLIEAIVAAHPAPG